VDRVSIWAMVIRRPIERAVFRPTVWRRPERKESAMRFVVFVPANKESEAGVLPTAEMLTQMGKFNEQLVKAGVMLAGEGLHPSAKGARITYSGGKSKVVDGPFTESKELVAGYWVIQVKSKEEAVAWMQRAPFDGGTTIELRQVFETEDFAASDPTGEIRAKEQALREQVAAQKG
jgi:hypothetical protein